MFFFSISEVIKWLGLSLFELVLLVISLFIFTILLAYKLENPDSLSWWMVFSPLFTFDGISAYFSTIVCIRLYLDWELRLAVARTAWVTCVLVLFLTFKILLCQRLEKENNLTYSVITIPIFILLKLLLGRGCQVS